MRKINEIFNNFDGFLNRDNGLADKRTSEVVMRFWSFMGAKFGSVTFTLFVSLSFFAIPFQEASAVNPQQFKQETQLNALKMVFSEVKKGATPGKLSKGLKNRLSKSAQKRLGNYLKAYSAKELKKHLKQQVDYQIGEKSVLISYKGYKLEIAPSARGDINTYVINGKEFQFQPNAGIETNYIRLKRTLESEVSYFPILEILIPRAEAFPWVAALIGSRVLWALFAVGFAAQIPLCIYKGAIEKYEDEIAQGSSDPNSGEVNATESIFRESVFNNSSESVQGYKLTYKELVTYGCVMANENGTQTVYRLDDLTVHGHCRKKAEWLIEQAGESESLKGAFRDIPLFSGTPPNQSFNVGARGIIENRYLPMLRHGRRDGDLNSQSVQSVTFRDGEAVKAGTEKPETAEINFTQLPREMQNEVRDVLGGNLFKLQKCVEDALSNIAAERNSAASGGADPTKNPSQEN